MGVTVRNVGTVYYSVNGNRGSVQIAENYQSVHLIPETSLPSSYDFRTPKLIHNPMNANSNGSATPFRITNSRDYDDITVEYFLKGPGWPALLVNPYVSYDFWKIEVT